MARSLAPYQGNDPYVFICFSHEDSERVEVEIRWLHEQGINVWWDEGISPGSEWSDVLADAIQGCARFLYFITPASVATENCRRELNHAIAEKRELLAVYLQQTDVSGGIRLHLHNRQALLKYDLEPGIYRERLTKALGQVMQVLPLPSAVKTQAVRAYKVVVPDGAEMPEPGAQPNQQSWVWSNRYVSVAVGSMVLIILVAVGMWLGIYAPTDDNAALLTSKPSIAVLAFNNMSGDSEQEYFSDGITEDIITGLSHFTELRVIARNSTFTFKGQAVDIREVGKKLNVRYVVEGSVRRSEGRVRVTVQLIDASTASNIWAQRYDRDIKDIFTLQDEITEEIVGRLGTQVERDSLVRTRSKAPNELAAYELVLQARPLVQSLLPEPHAKARTLLEKAVKIDPEYGAAYSELAWVYLDEMRFGFNPLPNPLDRAFEAAKKGVDLDPDNGYAHWILAKISFFRKNFSQFNSETEKALNLNPNDARSIADIGAHHCWLGRLERCLELTNRAIRLDPYHPNWLHHNLFFYYYLTDQFEKALFETQKMNVPEFFLDQANRAIANGRLGNVEEARLHGAKTLKLNPDFSMRRYYKIFNFPDSNIDKLWEGARVAGLPE